MISMIETYRRNRNYGQRPADALRDARAGKTHWARIGHVNQPFQAGNISQRSMAPRYRWIENVTRLGWRLAGLSHELNKSMRHTGWHTDPDGCDELLRGVVYRLPHGRFAYGYADPHNDDCALIADDLATDIDDAAQWADRVAELFAESERDYREAHNVARKAVSDATRARSEVRDALTILRDHAQLGIANPRQHADALRDFGVTWEAYRDAMSEQADKCGRALRWHGISYADCCD